MHSIKISPLMHYEFYFLNDEVFPTPSLMEFSYDFSNIKLS